MNTTQQITPTTTNKPMTVNTSGIWAGKKYFHPELGEVTVTKLSKETAHHRVMFKTSDGMELDMDAGVFSKLKEV